MDESGFRVFWGNHLETLASNLFKDIESCGADASDALSFRKYVIVPSRATAAWLQKKFLYDVENEREVLADIEFPLLNVFVNDVLFRNANPDIETERNPAAHPFSIDAMQWRIFSILGSEIIDSPDFAELKNRVDQTDKDSRRLFKLAGTLATLMDEYMVYRPDMLLDWEKGRSDSIPKGCDLWQPALWRAMTANGAGESSYLSMFMKIGNGIARSALPRGCNAIDVFNVSSMPRVYMWFFQKLSETVRVTFHLLNPSEKNWLDVPAEKREYIMTGRKSEEDELFQLGNLFLRTNGRACRDFLVELLDRTDGQSEADAIFEHTKPDSDLHVLQEHILENSSVSAVSNENESRVEFRSIQLHACHGQMREVESLRDNLLCWLSEEKDIHPRDITVQVADMATYVPYIQAVFGSTNPWLPDAIPFAIADRFASGESEIAKTFCGILKLISGRFTASEVVDAFRCPAVLAKFDATIRDADKCAKLVEDSGIRWGIDGKHRKTVSGFDIGESCSWRRGFNRMLLGFAIGEGADVAIPSADPIYPCDLINDREDIDAFTKLYSFFSTLEQAADSTCVVRTPTEWQDFMIDLAVSCFAETNETYAELLKIKKAIYKLGECSIAAGFVGSVTFVVAADSLIRNLDSAEGGDNLLSDSVTFCALRPGSSLPAKIVCVLGMADGVYPRRDKRPAYDVLRLSPRMCDRSIRDDDRRAFLEAVLSARDRLYVSYPGFDAGTLKRMPASTLVVELQDAVLLAVGRKPEPILHKLRTYDEAYFTENPTGLFSYSEKALDAANSFRRREEYGLTDSVDIRNAGNDVSDDEMTLDIGEVIKFFKDPCKAYFKETLRASLDVSVDAGTGNEESFEADHLSAYSLKTDIEKKMIEDSETHDDEIDGIIGRYMEDGKIPLGEHGAKFVKRLRSDTENWLKEEISKDVPLTRKIALSKMDESEPKVLSVCINEKTRITGKVSTTEGVIYNFRQSSKQNNAKDIVENWLTHLFVCASGETGIITIFGGSDYTYMYPSLNEVFAKAELSAIIDIYKKGLSEPLPFSAKAAIEEVAKPGSVYFSDVVKTDINDKFAKYKANPYLRRAFEARIACAGKLFIDLSKKVFGDEVMSRSKAKKTGAGK